MSCPICCSAYTKEVRKNIKCPFCVFESCRSCVETFLVQNTIAPKCMSCNTGWTIEFMRSVMTKTYMNTIYRNHQTNSLEAEAISTFPALQREAKIQEKTENIYKQIADINAFIQSLKIDIRRKYREISQLRNGITDEETKDRPNELMFPCPITDCKGTLEGGICQLCDARFCKKCHASEHGGECKQDDLENVRLIRQNTKSCPTCRNGIFKTEGCDQMWCTVCHTCFSWKTGNILNGTIHNPHFYEFVRNNGTLRRNPGDIPCGGMPSIYQMKNYIIREKFSKSVEKIILDIHRTNSDIQHNIMPTIHHTINRCGEKTREYGIDYLRKKINKEKWKNSLYLLHKKEECNRQFYNILETYSFNTNEIFRQFYNKNIEFFDFIHSINTLVSCYNEGVSSLNRVYNKKISRIPLFS